VVSREKGERDSLERVEQLLRKGRWFKYEERSFEAEGASGQTVEKTRILLGEGGWENLASRQGAPNRPEKITIRWKG